MAATEQANSLMPLAKLPVTANLDDAHYNALVMWANAHALAQDEVSKVIAKERAEAEVPQAPRAPAPPAPGPAPQVPGAPAPAPAPQAPKPGTPAPTPAPTGDPAHDAATRILGQMSAALYQEKDPAKLRSLATQARMQADSGAYSAADAAKLRAAAAALESRATALAGGVAPSPAPKKDDSSTGIALMLLAAAASML